MPFMCNPKPIKPCKHDQRLGLRHFKAWRETKFPMIFPSPYWLGGICIMASKQIIMMYVEMWNNGDDKIFDTLSYLC
jgi:hypothetical protein